MTRRVLLGALLLLLLLPGLAPAEEKWGPFRGRVVDAETGQGIAEAAILAIWLERWSTPVEIRAGFYDAKETLTRPDGSFEIPRLTPPLFRFRIMAPMFEVFAPGYGAQRWVVTPPTGEPLVAPTVIEMRRLRSRQDRLDHLGFASQPSIPLEKRCLYTRALNQEGKNLGLDLYPECRK
jgi:hypothetical protein